MCDLKVERQAALDFDRTFFMYGLSAKLWADGGADDWAPCLQDTALHKMLASQTQKNLPHVWHPASGIDDKAFLQCLSMIRSPGPKFCKAEWTRSWLLACL